MGDEGKGLGGTGGADEWLGVVGKCENAKSFVLRVCALVQSEGAGREETGPKDWEAYIRCFAKMS